MTVPTTYTLSQLTEFRDMFLGYIREARQATPVGQPLPPEIHGWIFIADTLDFELKRLESTGETVGSDKGICQILKHLL